MLYINHVFLDCIYARMSFSLASFKKTVIPFLFEAKKKLFYLLCVIMKDESIHQPIN